MLKRVNLLLQVNFLNDICYLRVTELVERIEIFTYCALNQERALGNKGDLLSQQVHSRLRYLNAVNQNLTLAEVY